MIAFVRPTPDDIPRIKEAADAHLQATYGTEIPPWGRFLYTIDQLSQIFRWDDSCWLATQDEHLVGFVRFGLRDFLSEIYGFFVHPDYRRQGIGTILLERMEADVHQIGLKGYGCRVPTRNQNGLQFLVTYGFELLPEKEKPENVRRLLRYL